eukprot:15143685-Alexandrium_andersonii.AAC.1
MLEDERLKDTALESDRRCCANCFAAVLDMLFMCPYCATHFTVPARPDNEADLTPEDLVLNEDCDLMIAAE